MFVFLYLLGTLTLVLNLVRPFPIDISVSDLFILLALVFLCLDGLASKKKLSEWMPIHRLWTPAMLILFGGLLSSMQAARLMTSITVTAKTWFVLTLWVSMGMVMVRRGQLSKVLAAFLSGVAFTSIIAIWDSFTGSDIGGMISGRTSNFWGRSDGTMGHPNELSFITSVAVPLFVGVLLHEWYSRRSLLRVSFYSAGLAAAVGANVLSGSVAGWLSICISSLVIVSIWLKEMSIRVRLLGVVGLAVILIAGGTFVIGQPPDGYFSSVWFDLNLRRAIDITGPGRLGLVNEAIQQIAESPIIGRGMDQVGTVNLTSLELVTSDHIHNTIILSWLAGGIFAWAGLVWIYAYCLFVAVDALRRSGASPNWIAIALSASVLGWIFFDQMQPSLFHRFTWLTVGLLLGMDYGLYRKRSYVMVRPGKAGV